MQAARSGLRSASALGVSSPMTSDTKVMRTITAPSAMASAQRAAPGSSTSAIQGLSASTAVAPPTAEARVPTSVIAICTVARKVSGSRLSASARSAPGTRSF